MTESARPSHHSRAAHAARFLFYCLLVWAPIPLGSNRAVFWAINALAACVILALFLAGEVTHRARSDIEWRPVAWALGAIGVVIAWMLFQAVVPLPAPFAHPVWTRSDPAAWGPISASPSATWTAIVQFLPLVLLAVVAMRLSVERKRVAILLKIVLAVTVGIAIYGLVARDLGLDQAFLIENSAYEGYLTGTFVGRNAAASFFVVGMLVATSLTAGRIEELLRSRGSSRSVFLNIAELIRRAGIYIVAVIVLAAALLNTGSRGGTIAAAIGLLAIALVALRRAKGERRATGAAFAAVFAFFLMAAAISSDVLLNRLEAGVGSGDRLGVFNDTLAMVAARPFLGHGGGAFADIYPAFHVEAPSASVWLHAHNMYLQTAAELGLPAALLLVAAAAIVLFVIGQGLADRREPKVAGIAAIGIVVAMAFHSTIDFGAQIQAVGLTILVLVGAALGEALGARAREQAREDARAGLGSIVTRRESFGVTVPAAVRRAPVLGER